jgi:hypothetical protein
LWAFFQEFHIFFSLSSGSEGGVLAGKMPGISRFAGKYLFDTAFNFQ